MKSSTNQDKEKEGHTWKHRSSGRWRRLWRRTRRGGWKVGESEKEESWCSKSKNQQIGVELALVKLYVALTKVSCGSTLSKFTIKQIKWDKLPVLVIEEQLVDDPPASPPVFSWRLIVHRKLFIFTFALDNYPGKEVYNPSSQRIKNLFAYVKYVFKIMTWDVLLRKILTHHPKCCCSDPLFLWEPSRWHHWR